jgi:hypothetical protein
MFTYASVPHASVRQSCLLPHDARKLRNHSFLPAVILVVVLVVLGYDTDTAIAAVVAIGFVTRHLS